ncbi:MAG: energy-coupling factor ABC transporter permease [Candidatus Methanomethylophilaceae archaeon]|nr:energy-coupling factor ABC transporter permease [Candidatus Methanomethylophilaceae archaeon]
MHIMEGYLPAGWCAVWFIIAIPIVYLGARKTIKIIREHPEQKMIVALSGAFIFLLSSLKMPSVTGSCSHPTGTGLAVVLYGIACTSFLSVIVLLFQAILLAHGGLTTLGANVFSMGIAGPAAGLLVWYVLRVKANVNIPIAMFFTAFVADLFTYVVTSIELTLAFGAGQYFTAFIEFMTTYSVTQIPLAIIEGILFAMFAVYLVNNKPELFGINEDESAKEVAC